MKILGIDPGTATTGWAIVEEVKKNPRLIACGCVNTSKFKTDADRLVIVDEQGVFIGEEYTLALTAAFVLGKRKGSVATNL